MMVARLSARRRRKWVAPDRQPPRGALDGGVRGVAFPRRQEPTMDEPVRRIAYSRRGRESQLIVVPQAVAATIVAHFNPDRRTT
jgi:hypothetical protein